MRLLSSILLVLAVFGTPVVAADDAKFSAERKATKRLLLIGQGPDKHPWSTHEYMSAMHVTARLLQQVDGLQTIVTQADEPWERGPELLDGADAAVVYISEGAKWLQQNDRRLAAFRKLAERGGGLTVLHWGMGCREAEPIKPFVELFGGCHGGPDRKFKVVEVETALPTADHPVVRGISPIKVKDEFYYTLKFAKYGPKITPLIDVPIDGEAHTVAWAWERADGGRSFGFSGLHFHDNWKLPEYRRLVAQGILWTIQSPIPEKGLNVDVSDKILKVQRPKPE